MAAAKNVYSDVVTSILAGTLNSSVKQAGKQMASCIVTSPATGIIGANADIVFLFVIPKGARLGLGRWMWEAGGAAAVAKCGSFNPVTLAAISDAAYKGAGGFTDMTSASTAGGLTFCDTVALGWGSVLTTDVLVGATFATATFQATAKIYAELEYTL